MRTHDDNDMDYTQNLSYSNGLGKARKSWKSNDGKATIQLHGFISLLSNIIIRRMINYFFNDCLAAISRVETVP